jgi:transposase
VVGREGGHIRLTVAEHTDGATLRKVVRKASWPLVTVNTDEWQGYSGLPGIGRHHATVCHAEREGARDDDGDGVREVHCNTLERLWTGLRNFLRPFRGVSKKYLYQYTAMFEWGYNQGQRRRSSSGLSSASDPPPVARHEPFFFLAGCVLRPAV